MHVLVLCESLNTDNGWGQYAAALISVLREQGIRITILSADQMSTGPRLPSVHSSRWTWFWACLCLWVWLRGRSFDLVHVMVEPYAYLSPIFGKCPFLITVHGTYADPGAHALAWRERAFARALQHATAIVAVSHYTQLVLPKEVQERSQVILNGVQLKILDEPWQTVDKHNSPLVVSVGALKDRKGFTELLAGFALFVRAHPSAELVIIGEEQQPGLRETLSLATRKQGMESRVRFLGHVSRAELLGWYRVCDVFALTPISKGGFEGFGLVYLEANVFGKPCVGSRNSGAAEAIVDGVNGYLVDPQDPENVARGLERALTLPEAPLRQWIAQQDWRARATPYRVLYEKAMRGRSLNGEANVLESMPEPGILKEEGWQLPRYTTLELHEKKSRYGICIPVMNEGEKIRKQLEDMRPFSDMVDIIMADWGSTDGSMDPNFLRQQNVRTLLTLVDKGRQGTQLRMAFAYALKQGYEGILQVDGNHKDGIEAIPEFIKELQEGYDYVQGSRFIKGGQAVNTPVIRWFAVRFLASPILSLSCRHWCTDVTNGFRAFSRKCLLHSGVQPFRSIFVRYELIMYLAMRARQLGLRTKEIPVRRAYPPGKVPTKISFLRGSSDLLTTIIKAALGVYNPKV